MWVISHSSPFQTHFITNTLSFELIIINFIIHSNMNHLYEIALDIMGLYPTMLYLCPKRDERVLKIYNIKNQDTIDFICSEYGLTAEKSDSSEYIIFYL